MKQLFLVGTLLAGIVFFSACSDDNEGSVGDELLGTSKVNILSVKSSNITITNNADNSPDLSQISTAFLGTLNDKVFGKTQSSVAFQLRLTNAVKLNNPEVDSVKMFLAYQNHYGTDTTLQQTARAFLLKKPIDYSEKYNATTNISSFLGDEVGSTPFNKNMVSDTIFLKSKKDNTKDSVINSKKQVDTILRHLAIKLDNEKVGNYILKAPESTFNGSEDFINYFNGLFIKTDDEAAEGAIYGFNVYNSYMKVYFKNHAILSSGKDTIYNSVLQFPVTDNSARFNLPKFSHSPLISSTDKIYLQGIHGTNARIEMPELAQWKDSTRISVNKAELIFKIATDSIEAKKYTLPLRLELKVVDNKGKKEALNYSALAGRTSLTGLLNLSDYTYVFQIPEYLQSIIDGKNTFSYFELAVSGVEQRQSNSGLIFYPKDAKNIPSRVVLYNSGENKPVLNVTYTKY